MVEKLPRLFPLGLTENNTLGQHESLTILRIDEKTLLETHQATGLCCLSLAILVLGELVQVRSGDFMGWNSKQLN